MTTQSVNRRKARRRTSPVNTSVRCTAESCADSENCRHRFRIFRARRGSNRNCHVHRLDRAAPERTGAGLGAGQRCRGFDHRLPLRIGAGYADIDHGRSRTYQLRLRVRQASCAKLHVVHVESRINILLK